MTRSMAIEELQDDEAVEALAGDEFAAPILAAIQHSFEEAMASIDELARSPWAERHPGTEKIDLRLVPLPAVPVETALPTAAMSLAARALAEHPVDDAAGSSTTASAPGTEHDAASARQEPVAPARDDSPEPAAPRRRRPRWWRP